MDIFGRLERFLQRRSDGIRGGAGRPTEPGDERRSGPPAPKAGAQEPALRPLENRSRDGVPSMAERDPAAAAAFGLSVFRHVAASPGNVCVSPLALRVALSALCEGARGETATQMRRALGLPADGPLPLASIGTRQARLLSGGALSGASALWVPKDVTLQSTYLDALLGAVDCSVGQADFAAPDEACARINAWAAEGTGGRIDRVVTPTAFDASPAGLVATATVCARSPGAQFFNVGSPMGFHAADGRAVSVPEMFCITRAPYFDVGDARGAVLALEDCPLSALLVVPADPDGLPALESRLSSDTLDAWLGAATDRNVYVTMPMLDAVSGTYDLTGACAAHGMPLMTRPEADFSGLFERHGDGRDAAAGGCGVVHGAALEFRRHDCEGQSFVLSSLLGAAPDSISLKVNRPFLFVVRDNRTGALVLVGRVSQPG